MANGSETAHTENLLAAKGGVSHPRGNIVADLVEAGGKLFCILLKSVIGEME
jgi:hypothetical protein